MDGSSRAACLFATSSVPGSKCFYFNNLEDRSAISSSLHLLSVSFNLDPKSSMAARQLGSLVLRFRARSSLLQESSCHSRFNLSRRWIQTTPNPEITKECENNTKDNSCSIKDVTADSSHENKSNSPSVNFSDLSSLKISPRHDLAMIFTCKVCETRSVKTVCRESYEKGVVVARCGGCNNLHLMADHLGWFGEPGSVENFLAARGEEDQSGALILTKSDPELSRLTIIEAPLVDVEIRGVPAHCFEMTDYMHKSLTSHPAKGSHTSFVVIPNNVMERESG